MLVLTRRHGESVRIGPDIRVTVVAMTGGQVRIAIDAPDEVSIFREELFEKVASANVEAASKAKNMISGLGVTKGRLAAQSGEIDNE